MPILDNIKHETFVQCLLKGMSQRQSYLEAYSNSKKWKNTTVDNKASKLANTSEVLARLQELQERSENQAIASVTRRKMILTEILEDEEEKANDRIKAIDSLNKMEMIGGENVNVNKNPYNELSVEELRKLARSDKYG
ncbi:terminase [Vagococcus carniphilus]|uniref:terminase n=1 Tax=Vagococcus carniphilus TaxID=218144 RepID=UPI00288CD469|nr:terminase [Vagococcus carniphilus]MDT2832262.1 terminase [Vagococcus carniphilus]MDT2840744.1 terminase [Vagococcus carniphilus]MDT2855735.1 terminase [Vagococcus carniphilus]